MSVPRIPSIEQLRQRADARALEDRFGREALTQALRDEAAALRATRHRRDGSATNADQNAPASGASRGPAIEPAGRGPDHVDSATPPADPDIAMRLVERAGERLAAAWLPSLRPVLNATGVVLHTNLGRAPLSRAALDRIAAVGAGYTNLEHDLASGRRGRRDAHAERLLTGLTGAEAAVVVNNNAAATLLALAALARGREVIVSRGELVEIGGGFRVPDVMAQSGAVLREVGTTNRTRIRDYAAAVSARTALILRVHPSNFSMSGFTERPDLRDLAALARELGVPIGEDLGSGNLLDAPASAALKEPSVRDSVAAGCDLVWFSGDKLLGGPQAGIIVGRRALLDRVRVHPLMRALRVDKLTYAALEATLLEYRAGRAAERVPVLAMIGQDTATLDHRARALAAALAGAEHLRASVIDGESAVGGGSAPGTTLPTRLVALAHPTLSPDALLARLRQLSTPVIARIEDGRVVLDLRTILPVQDEELRALVLSVGEGG